MVQESKRVEITSGMSMTVGKRRRPEGEIKRIAGEKARMLVCVLGEGDAIRVARGMVKALRAGRDNHNSQGTVK